METWSSSLLVLLLTFVRVIPKLKKLQFRQGQRIGYALIIFIIGSFSIGGSLYRLCYSIKFIITLNEGLGLQLLEKNS